LSAEGGGVKTESWALPAPATGVPVVVEPEDGGEARVLVAGSDLAGTVMLLSLSGEAVPGWPNRLGGPLRCSPLAVPVADGGVLEVVALSIDGVVVAWDENGSEKWRRRVGSGKEFILDPVAADVDRDGNYEIFLASADGQMALLSAADGSYEDGWPLNLGGNILVPPVLSDPDADGFLEPLFLIEGGYLAAYNRDGTLVSDFPVPLEMDSPEESGPLGVADLTGDGIPEIILGNLKGELWVFFMNGHPLSGFPKSVGGSVRTTPLAFDMDGDGLQELMVVSDSGVISVWDTPAVAPDKEIGWRMDRFDLRRSNLWSRENLPDLVPVRPGLITSFYNYPNPTEGGNTTFRFRLSRPSRVNLDFFTLNGIPVFSTTRDCPGPEVSEIGVDVSNLAPGVYICRLKAVSGDSGEAETKFCKMAVTR